LTDNVALFTTPFSFLTALAIYALAAETELKIDQIPDSPRDSGFRWLDSITFSITFRSYQRLLKKHTSWSEHSNGSGRAKRLPLTLLLRRF
jgi:hypothetical protein